MQLRCIFFFFFNSLLSFALLNCMFRNILWPKSSDIEQCPTPCGDVSLIFIFPFLKIIINDNGKNGNQPDQYYVLAYSLVASLLIENLNYLFFMSIYIHMLRMVARCLVKITFLFLSHFQSSTFN